MRKRPDLLKAHMRPPPEEKPPPDLSPEPIDPPASAEKPPVTDAAQDNGEGSVAQGEIEPSLLAIGLGALILFSYGMVRK